MAWPSTVSTTNVDSGSDLVSSARADIKSLFDAVNAIIGARGTAGGFPSKDGSSLTQFDTNFYAGLDGGNPTILFDTGDKWVYDRAANAIKQYLGSALIATYPFASAMLLNTNNLSDVSSAATARTNLDVYSKDEVDAISKNYVKAYCLSNTISANTDIVFDVESVDTGSYYDNATGIFLPTVAGRWLIIAQISYTAGSKINFGLYLEGTIYAESIVRDSGDQPNTAIISDIVLFNGTTNYLTVRSSAASSYVSNRSVRFTAVKL